MAEMKEYWLHITPKHGIGVDMQKYDADEIDLMPVIRCGACKYFVPGETEQFGDCKIFMSMRLRNDNDFCSDAERKEKPVSNSYKSPEFPDSSLTFAPEYEEKA